MKYYGKITDDKDLVTKEYVDGMSKKFLDADGLQDFWDQVKQKLAFKTDIKTWLLSKAGNVITLKDSDGNNESSVTLDAYTHPSYTARTGKPTANQEPSFGGTFTVTQITSDATGHVTGATDRTVKIPNTAATQSAAGLMSAEDKAKLDGIADGAQANAVTGVKGSSETSYRTGNVNITKANLGLGNVENKSSATIRGELTKANVTDALGYTPPEQDTTYAAATQSAAGLMSAADKTRLDKAHVEELGTAIPSNADLNDYTANGTYYIGSAAIAATISNNPRTTTGGKLIVMSITTNATRLKQVLIPASNANTIYMRWYNGSWNDWYTLDTKYSLSKSGSTITLTGSDGSTSSIADSDSDEKVALKVTNPTSGNARYAWIPFDTTGGATPADRAANTLGINDGLYLYTSNGTASAEGLSYLTLGNATAKGTAGNKTGGFYIYAENGKYYTVKPAAITANRTLTLPLVTAAGTLLGKSTTAAVGDANTPVYFTANGVATKCGFAIKIGTAEPESAGLNDGDLYFKYS